MQVQEVYNIYCEVKEVCLEISEKIKKGEYRGAIEELNKLTPINSLEYLINQDDFEYQNIGLWSKLSELIGYLKNRIEIMPNILENAEKLKEEGGDPGNIYKSWKLIDKTIEKIDKEFAKYDIHEKSNFTIYAWFLNNY